MSSKKQNQGAPTTRSQDSSQAERGTEAGTAQGKASSSPYNEPDNTGSSTEQYNESKPALERNDLEVTKSYLTDDEVEASLDAVKALLQTIVERLPATTEDEELSDEESQQLIDDLESLLGQLHDDLSLTVEDVAKDNDDETEEESAVRDVERSLDEVESLLDEIKQGLGLPTAAYDIDGLLSDDFPLNDSLLDDFSLDNEFSTDLGILIPESLNASDDDESPLDVDSLVPDVEEMLERLRDCPERWHELADDPELYKEFEALSDACSKVQALDTERYRKEPFRISSPYRFPLSYPLAYGMDDDEQSKWRLSQIRLFVETIEPSFLWIHESLERRSKVQRYLLERADLHDPYQPKSPDPELLACFQKSSPTGHVREFEKFDRWIELGLWDKISGIRQHWTTMREHLLSWPDKGTWTRGEWVEGLSWYLLFATDFLDRFVFNAMQCALPLSRSFVLNYLSTEGQKLSLTEMEDKQKLLFRDSVRLHQQLKEQEQENMSFHVLPEHYGVFLSDQTAQHEVMAQTAETLTEAGKAGPKESEESEERDLAQGEDKSQEDFLWPDASGEELMQDVSTLGHHFVVATPLLSLTLRGVLSSPAQSLHHHKRVSFVDAQYCGNQKKKALVVLVNDVALLEKMAQQILDRDDNPDRDEVLGPTRVLFVLHNGDSTSSLPPEREAPTLEQTAIVCHASTHMAGLADVERYFAYLECLDSLLIRKSWLDESSDAELARGIRLYEAAGARKWVVLLLEEKIERGDKPGALLLSLLDGKLREAYEKALSYQEEAKQDGSLTNTIYWQCVSHMLSSFGRLKETGASSSLSLDLENMSQHLLQASQSGESKPGWRAQGLAQLLRDGRPLERLFHDIYEDAPQLKELLRELERVGRRGEREPLFLSLRSVVQTWIQIKERQALESCHETKAKEMYLKTLSTEERETIEEDVLDLDTLHDLDPRISLEVPLLQRYFDFPDVTVEASTKRFAFPREVGQDLLKLWHNNVKKHARNADHSVQLSESPAGALRWELSDRGPGLLEAGLDRLRNRQGSFGKLLLESGWFSRVLVLTFSLNRERRVIPLLGDTSADEREQLVEEILFEPGCTFLLESPCALE